MNLILIDFLHMTKNLSLETWGNNVWHLCKVCLYHKTVKAFLAFHLQSGVKSEQRQVWVDGIFHISSSLEETNSTWIPWQSLMTAILVERTYRRWSCSKSFEHDSLHLLLKIKERKKERMFSLKMTRVNGICPCSVKLQHCLHRGPIFLTCTGIKYFPKYHLF